MRIRTRLLALASATALLPAFLGASTQPSWAVPARNETPRLAIGAVQGPGASSPYAGRTVIVEGVVTGDFQGEGQLGGVFIQDAGDGDEATSDGIFVHDKGANELAVGDRVQVKGKVGEYKDQTQITPTTVTKLDGGNAVAPLELNLPVTDWERHEGMLLRFPQALTILDSHDFDRYGEIAYGTKRQWAPTGVVDPGQPAIDLLASNKADRLTVDDGRSSQNPTPAVHPNGKPMARDNYFRTGDQVANLTGVLGYSFGSYRLQPTAGADHTASNPRPPAPEKQGNLRVASFNVLNYFTTLTSDDSRARGADTPEEFQRQQAKIVAAMTALDADVFGLMEIENNGIAVDDLVAALNARVGEGTYAAVKTGKVGSDAIFQAFVYKPATVEPAGSFETLSFGNTGNRPSLLQTFRHKDSGELVNVSVNHLKSKGSACKGDPDTGDGQGNCNQTRNKAAEDLVSWLRGDPTGQGAARTLIIGDLNSYDHEDPVKTLVEGGLRRHGEEVHRRTGLFLRLRRHVRLSGSRTREPGRGNQYRRRPGLAHQRGRGGHFRLRHDLQESGGAGTLQPRPVSLLRPRPGGGEPPAREPRNPGALIAGPRRAHAVESRPPPRSAGNQRLITAAASGRKWLRRWRRSANQPQPPSRFRGGHPRRPASRR